MSFQILNRALSELETALKECGVKLIVGGGFGLYLLQSQLESDVVRTLIDRNAWCVARTTADIDILLEANIVANLEQFQAIRQILDQLEYKVIPGVEYMHFEKHFSDTERVEINFLTGPVPSESLSNVQIGKPRVRPRGTVKLHAYLTPEVIALSETIRSLAGTSNLFIPSSATLLVMKLHAFQDRYEKDEQEKSAHHAMDVYRIVSMMTESQFDECKAVFKTNCESASYKDASSIVAKYFGRDSPGILKIREHNLYQKQFDLETCCSVLQELFSQSHTTT